MTKSIIYITPQTTLLTQDGTQVPSLTFDAVTTFTPSFTNDITSYPVSNKSIISNHVVKRNPTFVVEGWVSTAPTKKYENNLVGYENNIVRPQTVYNLIKSWDVSKIDLTLVYEFDVYNQCQIKSWEPVLEGSDSVLIKINFEQVRRASYKRVTIVQNMSDTKKTDATPNSGSTVGNGTVLKRQSQIGIQIQDQLGNGETTKGSWWGNVKEIAGIDLDDDVGSTTTTGGSN